MSTLLNAAVGVAALAYADARYGLGNDLFLAKCSGKASINHLVRGLKGQTSLYSFFDKQVKSQPNALAYMYEGRTWTWKEAEAEVNRIANFLLSKGLQPEDRIAIFMHNSVHFILIWLACLSINVVPAFINNSLTGPGLVHCVKVSRAKLLIYEAALEAPLIESEDLLKETLVREYVCLDDGIPVGGEKGSIAKPSGKLGGSSYFGPIQMASSSPKASPESAKRLAQVTDSSIAALIFTSGTTGMPKAALCAHGRMGFALAMWPALNNFTPKDRIYTPMPVYHSSAAFLCVGASWCGGSTVIIGRKFSASRYWAEVRANEATVVQYIGEIARYLLAVPPHPDDKNHKVRLAYGNGMRPDVWEKFRERFGVKHISEFYASSEGNGALMNYNTGPYGAGAVGRFASLISKARPDFKIIRVDAISEELAKDPKTGFCIECEPGETGEFIMRISNRPAQAFMGYADNPEATKKKVLVNVFDKGDAFFRSGDLMKRDADGFYWFSDRIGDTYRWRGENVSCAEVASVFGEVVEANVYGVALPGHEGRCGCAAIPAPQAEGLDLKALATLAKKRLPKYAVPIFIRLVPELNATGTVKHVKVNLRNEGVDPAKVGSDPILWLPPGAQAYTPFSNAEWEKLKSGGVKL